jgi:hypothetical protein
MIGRLLPPSAGVIRYRNIPQSAATLPIFGVCF